MKLPSVFNKNSFPFRSGSLTVELLFLVSLTMSQSLHAGYVWTADATGAYAGTASPWTADSTREGKWILSGTTNAFTGDLDVAGSGADQRLTIDAATVTSPNAARISKDSNPAYLTIQNGGTLNLGNTLSISDSTGVSSGYVKVDGGTITSTGEIRVGFHWNGDLQVINGGSVTTTGNMQFGGDARRGRGTMTIGGDAETNTGSVSVKNLTMLGYDGASQITINRGSLEVGTGVTIGTNNVVSNTVTKPLEMTVNVNQFGTLTAGSNISVANQAMRNGILNVTGGSVSANRIILGDAAGKGTLNIENGSQNQASVTARENMVVGNLGTGELNLKSGTLSVCTVSGETTTWKSFYVGGNNTSGVGSGTANISGGELKANSLYVGYQNTGTMNVTGGKVTAAGELIIGHDSKANGTVIIGSADGQNVPVVSAVGKVTIGAGGTGSLTLKNGSLTAKEILVGSANASTLTITGGTLTTNGAPAAGSTSGYLTLANGSVEIGSADGQNAPTINLRGNAALRSGSLTMRNGSLTAAQIMIGSSKDAVLNLLGGSITTANMNVGASSVTGYLNLGAEASPQIADLSIAGSINIGNSGNGVVTVRNANVTLNGACNIGSGGSSSNCVLDLGQGAVLTMTTNAASSNLLRMGMGSTSGTFLVHDGGKFIMNGARFLVGDTAGTKNFMTVTGEGSSIQSNTSDFCLGYHGSAFVTIADGGSITGSNIKLGVNRASDAVLPSELTIYGKGSLLKATGTLMIGNASMGQTGSVNLLASETGFGTVNATNVTLGAGSSMNLDLDHSAVLLRNYSSAGYDVLKTKSDVTLNVGSLWQTTTTTTDGWKTTTATLRESLRQSGTMTPTGETIQIADGLQGAGWIAAEIGDETSVELTFSGLNGWNDTQLLADWLSDGTDGAFTASASSLNSVTLKDLLPGTGIFAWDFGSFNAANSLNVALTSATAYVPEPAAWLMMLLGGALIFAKRRALRVPGLFAALFLVAGSLSAAETAIQVTTSDWVTASDWTGGVPAADDSVYVGNASTVTSASAVNLGSGSLTVGYASANFATNPGTGTLTIAGGLTVGNLNLGLTNTLGKLTVSGGTVSIGSGTANALTVFNGDLDLSSAESANINVGNFHVMTGALSANPARAAVLKFAKATTITANEFRIMDSTTTGLPNMLCDVTFGSGPTVLNVGTVTFGGGKAEGSNSKAVSVTVNGGSFTLAGKETGTKATLRIAYDSMSTANPSIASVDLSGASSVTMALSNVGIGFNLTLMNASKTTTGSLNLGEKATVTADTFYVARHESTNTAGKVSGSLTFGGTSSVTAGSILMGSSALSTSLITMTGGTLNVSGDFISLGTSSLKQTAGVTTVGGSFSIGTLTLGSENSSASLTTGATGKTAAVGTGTEAFTIVNGTADFSAADSLTVNVASITMASKFSKEAVNAAAVWNFAKTSTVTASKLTMLDAEQSNLGGSTAAVTLGSGTNTLQIDSLIIGGCKAFPVAGVGGASMSIADGGKVILTGKAGTGSKASLRIAYDAADTGGPSVSTVDFSTASSVSMTLSDWVVGLNLRLYGTENGKTTGILNLGNSATVTADSLSIGTYDASKGQAGYSTGTLTGSGTITIGTAAAPGAMTLGSGWASQSTLTLSGGSLTLHGDLSGAGAIAMKLGTSTKAQNFTVDSGSVNLGKGSGSLTLYRGKIEFSAVEDANINLNSISLINTDSGTANAQSEWTFGTNSSITAKSLTMADSSGSNLLGQQVLLTLGSGTNDLNVDVFTVGGSKADGTGFTRTDQAVKVLVADGGKVTLDGAAEGALADLKIGNNSVTAGTSDVSHGLMDFSNASEVTMNLKTLTIGFNSNTSGGNATADRFTTGELKLGGNASVTADSILIGTFNKEKTNKNSVLGTLSFDGNTKIAVNGAVTLGQDSTLSHSVLTMAGGELTAGSMTMAGDAKFNWTGGTLGVNSIAFDLTQNAAASILNPGGTGLTGSTTINGDYAISDGKLVLEVNGPAYDTLEVTGDLDWSGNAQFILNVLNAEDVAPVMDLVSVASTDQPMVLPTITGLTEATKNWSFTWLGSSGNWTLGLSTTVPEPATWLMLFMGGILFLNRNFRNMRKKSLTFCAVFCLMAGTAANLMAADVNITDEADPYVITIPSGGGTNTNNYSATSLHGLKITGSFANYNLNGVLSGNVRLIVDYGTGASANNSARVLLNGTANTFDGGVQLTTGTLRYGTLTSLGSGAIDFNGGVLMSGVAGDVSNNMNLTAGSWGGLRGSLGMNVRGQISGDGDLIIVSDGAPVTLFNTANNYAGITSVGTIQGGANINSVLTLGADGVLPATTILEIGKSTKASYSYVSNGNAKVYLNGKTNTVAGLSGTGVLAGGGTLNVNVAEGQSHTFSGTFAENPNLTIGGTGTQIIEQAANSALGTLTLGTGTLQLAGSGKTVSVNRLALSADSHQLDLNGKNLTISGLNVTGNTFAGKVTNTAAAASQVTLSYAEDLTFDTSFLTGNVQLVLNGTGGRRLYLTANQTFTGGIKVSSCVVRPMTGNSDVTFLGAIPAAFKADAIILDGGSIQNTDCSISINANQGITVTENGGTVRMGFLTAYTAEMNSVISGTGWFGVTADMGCSVLLNAVNTYAGETRIGTSMNSVGATVGGAVLASMVNGALPSTSNIVFGTSSANLQLKGTTQSVGALISRENCLTTSEEGAVANMGLISTLETASLTIGNGNASGVFTGRIMDSDVAANSTKTLQLIKIGTGTQVLGGSLANTKTNLIVQGGTVELAKTANYAAQNLTITSGTVKLTGSSGNQINGALTLGAAGNLNLNGKTESVGLFTAEAGSQVDLAGGTLIVTSGTGSSAISNSVSASQATLQFSDGGGLTLTGSITGNTKVVKTGAGRQYLTGANTYSGGTSIQGGILYAAGGSLGAGTIEFLNGGMLMNGGTTTYSNNFLLTGNGVVRAGAGANGTVLTLAGNVSGSGKLQFNEGEGNGGSFVLSGTNTYDGGTDFLGTGASNSYRVTLKSDSALGTGTATVNVVAGGVNLIFDATTSDRTISNNITLNGKALDLTVTGTNAATYSGKLSGTGTVTSTGVNYLLNLDELTEDGSLDRIWDFSGTAKFSDSTIFSFVTSDPTQYAGKTLYLMDPSSITTGLGSAILQFANSDLWQTSFTPSGDLIIQTNASAIPEPASWALLLLGLGFLLRFRKRANF